jgi:predicted GNAT family acetyltransferase
MSQIHTVGDIVSIHGYENDVFVVADSTIDEHFEDYEDEEIEYEVHRIFPIYDDEALASILVVVDEDISGCLARAGTQYAFDMYAHTIKKRQELFIYREPEWLRMIGFSLKDFTNDIEDGKISAPNRKPVKFNKDAFTRMMSSEEAEDKIEIFTEKMDTHLTLLHKALQEENQKEIDFQKEQLGKVRDELMQLEYFKMADRRDGTSLRVKK